MNDLCKLKTIEEKCKYLGTLKVEQIYSRINDVYLLPHVWEYCNIDVYVYTYSFTYRQKST